MARGVGVGGRVGAAAEPAGAHRGPAQPGTGAALRRGFRAPPGRVSPSRGRRAPHFPGCGSPGANGPEPTARVNWPDGRPMEQLRPLAMGRHLCRAPRGPERRAQGGGAGQGAPRPPGRLLGPPWRLLRPHSPQHLSVPISVPAGPGVDSGRQSPRALSPQRFTWALSTPRPVWHRPTRLGCCWDRRDLDLRGRSDLGEAGCGAGRAHRGHSAEVCVLRWAAP